MFLEETDATLADDIMPRVLVPMILEVRFGVLGLGPVSVVFELVFK